MDNKMIPENVKLIVKAACQQIADQNIQCLSSWTIGQLKGHLAEVYPSKPNTEEQKIIYAGQILEDSAVLRDVLRIYSTEVEHTLYLVFRSKEAMGERDGLRRRNVESVERPPESRQNETNHSVEMQNYLSSYVNNYSRGLPYSIGNYLPLANDPTAMANHMLMMQQAYMQYMQQYANMWQASGNMVPNATPVTDAPQVQVEQVPEQPVLEPEDPEDARDLLDWVYTGARVAILLTLVYFYSTPARLVMVLLLLAVKFFFSLQRRINNGGLFGDVFGHPAQQNPIENRNPQENRNQPDNRNQAENNQTENDNQTENANAPEIPNENQQSFLAVTWLIFSTFFTSLIPDNQP